MKIKIKKCSHPFAWYSDKIGQEFKVYDIGGETDDSYGVAIDSIRTFWYIPFYDCEITEAKILNLSLKKEWFDMILDGEKKEEYREKKKYWSSRLIDSIKLINGRNIPISRKEFDIIKFTNGYSELSPYLYVQFNGWEIKEGREDWGAEKEKSYFALQLGYVLEYGNLKDDFLRGSEAAMYWDGRVIDGIKSDRVSGLFKNEDSEISKKKWIAFDDKSTEMFTEEFNNRLEAIKWLNE